MAAAAQWLWREMGVAAELSGATAVAAILSGRYCPAAGERVCAVVCGAGTDGFISRGTAGSLRESSRCVRDHSPALSTRHGVALIFFRSVNWLTLVADPMGYCRRDRPSRFKNYDLKSTGGWHF